MFPEVVCAPPELADEDVRFSATEVGGTIEFEAAACFCWCSTAASDCSVVRVGVAKLDVMFPVSEFDEVSIGSA